MNGSITFDGVWKKFQRGERHDSLRDLLPSIARNLFRRRDAMQLDRNEFWILRDVTFQVEPGQALGIIGRNGAGKSTTLKLLTRILRPTRGTTRITGRVGALIEIAAGFHPDLTGRENVYLQGAILGMKRHDIDRNLDRIVDFAELGEFMDTPVKRYSSGMNARLGFSIAAHLQPDVLLIDEVLAVGDLKFQQRCYDKLREFRNEGVSIAFVSHNMQAIASLCDRALLLRPGSTPILGAVSEVVAQYASGAAAADDPRITLEEAQLTHTPTGAKIEQDITPGTPLTLTVRATAHVDLPRCCLQLWVHRSDGLSIFDGVSFTDGLAPVAVRAGQAIEASVSFTPNLLKGMYTIGLSLVDVDRGWKNLLLPSVASFIVTDNHRWGGCAELNPTYRLRSSTRAAETPVEEPTALRSA
ncbi:MAG TPA: ABC transporter ATP-binding protein [Vicinamibacterales bacterium]|nr:ABC transporter ATP-binding protein [Vicinamibacterales bacterium]